MRIRTRLRWCVQRAFGSWRAVGSIYVGGQYRSSENPYDEEQQYKSVKDEKREIERGYRNGIDLQFTGTIEGWADAGGTRTRSRFDPLERKQESVRIGELSGKRE